MKYNLRLLLISFLQLSFIPLSPLSAQTGSSVEPVAYVGGEICNPRLHNGGFRYAIGTENIQVMRANRTNPDQADGFGWTYNHAPNITYWRGQFYLAYLSNPKDEQQPPGHTMIVHSADGRHWSKPEVAFPVYKAPKGVSIPKGYTGYIMHQRMNFYTAPNGKLLVLGFYGHSYNPFKEGGIGRVVREMRKDGTMGPIYFLRYSSHTHWNQSNTSYPFYRQSKDKKFVAACDSLLADPLRTLQWIDEDRGLDNFYRLKENTDKVQATCYYHRKDGKVVALWKWSYAALSPDEGQTWSTPVRCPSLIMAGGKQWGQRTADGRFAICYNPIETQPYRYPLIITTSNDGIIYDSMCVVHGEVPPRRFMGENKDFGPCYVRGIVEGEQQPDDKNMWVTYSVNKEDIWVSRIPLSVRTCWQGNVDDDFLHVGENGPVPNWNIYRPLWCPVWVNSNHQLCLKDSDPYDYARAIRVFETGKNVAVEIKMTVEAENGEPFEVEVTDRFDNRAACLSLKDGEIHYGNTTIGQYQIGEPFNLKFEIGQGGMNFQGKTFPLMHAVKDVERLSLRTGQYRSLPDRNTPNQKAQPPLEGCDVQTKASSYSVSHVRIHKIPEAVH